MSRVQLAWAAFDARIVHGDESPEYVEALAALDESLDRVGEMRRVAAKLYRDARKATP